MKFLVSFIVVVVCLSVTACSPSLPQEAREALDESVGPNHTYSITSAQRATNPGTYDEVWCVVIDPPIPSSMFRNGISHFLLYREGLLWTELRGAWENVFLQYGCDNHK